jgi:hypothetical protein
VPTLRYLTSNFVRARVFSLSDVLAYEGDGNPPSQRAERGLFGGAIRHLRTNLPVGGPRNRKFIAFQTLKVIVQSTTQTVETRT